MPRAFRVQTTAAIIAVMYSMYDSFKWTVLEDAPHMHQSSIAYFWVQ
jgi:hypothetical protein